MILWKIKVDKNHFSFLVFDTNLKGLLCLPTHILSRFRGTCPGRFYLMYVCDTPSAGARNHLSALLRDGRRLLEILGCCRRKIYGSASYSWIIA